MVQNEIGLAKSAQDISREMMIYRKFGIFTIAKKACLNEKLHKNEMVGRVAWLTVLYTGSVIDSASEERGRLHSEMMRNDERYAKQKLA